MARLHKDLPVLPMPEADSGTITSTIPAVPDLTGLDVEAATRAGELAGFTKIRVETLSVLDADAGTPGLVARQDPQPGTRSPVSVRETLTLFTSE